MIRRVLATLLLTTLLSMLLAPLLFVSASNDDWNVAAEFTYYPLAENEYGKINLVVQILTPKDDINSQHDYFIYKIVNQVVPKNGFWWRTKYIWIKHEVLEGNILDYDPTTTVGESSVTISFSPEGVQYSWTYSTPDVTIYDKGDMSQGIAAWNHEIYYMSNAARYPYKVKPGVLVSVPKGGETWAMGDYKVTFRYFLADLYRKTLKPSFCPVFWARKG